MSAHDVSRLSSAPRAGVALVSALALLALSAALLAIACVSARSIQRGARTLRASAEADAAARRTMAKLVAEWSVAIDSIPIGGSVDRSPADADERSGVRARGRVSRLAPGLYAIVVEAHVGAEPMPDARRRYRLLLERDAGDSAHAHDVPHPLRRWSFSDIY